MSLGNSIVQQVLARPSDLRAAIAQKGSYVLDAVEGFTAASVKLDDADRLGCIAASIEVERAAGPERADTPSTDLKEKAAQLKQRLGYLLENLDIVEVDCRRAVCQIRSSHAEVGEFYYEIMLEARGRVSLARYSKSSGPQGRTATGMNFSLEVLQRLIDDLAAVV